MARARDDDPKALEVLFGQFVPAGERIVVTRYMGVMGLWGIGTHSFAAITDRRVASLRVGLLGELVYNDGALEYVNSSAVFQPSRLQMYLPAVVWAVAVVGLSLAFGSPVVTLLALLVALAGVPLIVRAQYRLRKSGLVVFIREGLSVHVFIDRRRIALANHMYRLCCDLRDERIRQIGQP